jgi:hypothetical protein
VISLLSWVTWNNIFVADVLGLVMPSMLKAEMCLNMKAFNGNVKVS